jgi:hypothetical protein
MDLSDASEKIPSDTTGDRSGDLLTSSAVRNAISITYSECAFVALGIRREMRVSLVICGLPGSAVFVHIIS